MTNMDKLYASVAANGPVCVGLDTEFSYLPADVVDYTKTAGENVVEFNRRIIEATKASAGCYKVQIAYYESLGLDGMRAYAETLKMVRATGLPVIADIKRGDMRGAYPDRKRGSGRLGGACNCRCRRGSGVLCADGRLCGNQLP